ncbi:MAG: transglutaminase family protein [Sulfuricurvum sp.]|uniref:transglutaminase-like domain-containing protein n=1 Tax=Sulfuricurvum sp. TaxID=2025608 RepID=UPI0025EAE613|nr:transglutaminase family protein [Sulfuricurvum sp.]MCK9372114.1 transglutaminase family protein [Sulfuricurvum sp.]
MWLHTSCDLTFNIEVPTPFVLMLRPQSGVQQWIAFEEYRIVPTIPVFEFIDNYGNFCQRLIAPPGDFAIFTAADVMTSDYIDQAPGAEFVEIQNLPNNVLCYLLPSRYCESDSFSQMAGEITAGKKLGYDQVSAIVEWLRARIRFEPNRNNMPVSAKEVNVRGWGVCRDLSHLGIALCRSLSIPARMVVGYLYELEPMDLHAWFEVYVGERWYTFDATQVEMKGGYVALGYGRDAADVAVYNQFGPGLQPISQQINVVQINHQSKTPHAAL